jgi:hypothetical protein
MKNFNGSIWHALWILVPLAGIIFSLSFLVVKPGFYYFFDPKHNGRVKDGGDYGPHMQRY